MELQICALHGSVNEIRFAMRLLIIGFEVALGQDRAVLVPSPAVTQIVLVGKESKVTLWITDSTLYNEHPS